MSPEARLDSIHVKLPTAWALKSQIQLPGGEFPRRSDPPVPGPVTLLTLRPEHPIWGSQRLVLRSVLPLVPGQEMPVPEITPLGHGLSDTYLGLVFAAGSIPATAGTSGLHRIPYASHFQAPEFARSPGTESRAFRVDQKNWNLKVQVPPATEPRGAGEESARVVSADLEVTVSPDRVDPGPRRVRDPGSHRPIPGRGPAASEHRRSGPPSIRFRCLHYARPRADG